MMWHRTGSAERTAASAGATLLIMSLFFGFGLLAWNRVASIVDRRGVVLLDLTLPLWFVVVVLVTVGLVRQGRTPKRLWWLPPRLQSALRELLEVSAFGAGSLRGWTLTNPGVGIDRVAWPEPIELVDPTLVPVARSELISRDRNLTWSRVPTATTGTGAASPDLAAMPREMHRLERGETWWSLAERFLDDPRQWAGLRALNLGCPVESGVVITEETVLRPGWQIQVPTPQTTKSSRSDLGP